MAKVFTANVVLRKSRGAEPTVFSIGDEVPEWAEDKVSTGITRDSDAPTADTDESIIDEGADGSGEGENLSAGAGDDDDDEGDYAEYSVEELRGEAKERELKGYSKLDRAGLIALLEKDDAENPEA